LVNPQRTGSGQMSTTDWVHGREIPPATDQHPNQ